LEESEVSNISSANFDKKPNKFKKIILILSAIFVTLIVLVGSYFVWLNFFGPIATINGKTITRKEYQDQVAYDKKVLEFTDNSADLKKLDEFSRKKIIEKTIIQTEAKKRNIVISEVDIQSRYNDIISSYKNDADYQKTMTSIAGESADTTKDNIKIELQKEALEKQVVRYYDLGQLFYRNDMLKDGKLDISRNQQSKARIDGLESQLKAGKTWKSIVAQTFNDVEFPAPLANVLLRKKVTKAMSEEIDLSAKDWSEISKLKKVGDFTPVVESNGGFYSIFYAEFVSSGTYGTWDEYINSFAANPITKVAFGKNNFFQAMLSKLVSTAYACDSIADLMAEHAGTMLGTTKILINGTEYPIKLDTLTPTPVYTKNWCAGASSPVTTISDGSYRIEKIFCGYTWKLDPQINQFVKDGITYKPVYKSNSADFYARDGTPVVGENVDIDNFNLMVNGGTYNLNMLFVPRITYDLTVIKAGTGQCSVKSTMVEKTTVVKLTPIRSYFNPTTKLHFLTGFTSEYPVGYEWQSEAFYADTSAVQTAGSAPVFRLYDSVRAGHPTSEGHFYTTSVAEKDAKVALGWTPEVTAFYAYTTAVEGSIPVYRYLNSTTKDNYYSIVNTTPVGYAKQGTAFYTKETKLVKSDAFGDGNINCDETCKRQTAAFPSNDIVTLSAGFTSSIAGPLGVFKKWDGACTNTTGDCVVTMDGAKEVTAICDVNTAIPICNISVDPKEELPIANNRTISLKYDTTNAVSQSIDGVAVTSSPVSYKVQYDGTNTEKKIVMNVLGGEGGNVPSTCDVTVSSVCKCDIEVGKTVCKGEKYADSCGVKSCDGTKVGGDCPVPKCSVSIGINPKQKSGVDSFAPDVSVSVLNATSATLSYDAEDPTPITLIDGNYTKAPPLNDHTFVRVPDSSEDIHSATVKCFDGETPGKEETAKFTFKDEALPCPGLCPAITKSILNNSATTDPINGDYTRIFDTYNVGFKPVDVSLTVAEAEASKLTKLYWNYLSRFGDTAQEVLDLVKNIGGNGKESKSTPWLNPIGDGIRFPDYGDYALNLVGYGPGQEVPLNTVTCNSCPEGTTREDCYSCPIPVNILDESCKATEITPSIPVPIGGYEVFDDPETAIDFSVVSSKVAPGGVQSWELLRDNEDGKGYVSVNLGTPALEKNDTNPSIKYVFKFTGDEANKKFPPGRYKIKYLASSMLNGDGTLNPNGECSKELDFRVSPAIAKCTLTPVDVGKAPQPLAIKLQVDDKYYTGKMNLMVNSKPKVPFNISSKIDRFPGYIFGDYSTTLEKAGRYNVAVEAERTPFGLRQNVKTILCSDTPTNPRLVCADGRLCNFTVTNTGGGGGTEVAP